MADSPVSPAPPGAAALPGETPTQTKARLRRERLAAKSGASRLQQITALQGGPVKHVSEFEKDVPGTFCPCLVLSCLGLSCLVLSCRGRVTTICSSRQSLLAHDLSPPPLCPLPSALARMSYG
jgi:hypothetical protein